MYLKNMSIAGAETEDSTYPILKDFTSPCLQHAIILDTTLPQNPKTPKVMICDI